MTISRRNFLISSAILANGSLAATVTSRAGSSKELTHNPFNLEALDVIVDKAVLSGNTPGIALAVWKNGQQIYSRNSGVANFETETRISDLSVFRIGSLTKQFAGALVLSLVAQKKLSLSDFAHTYLPFLAKHDPFTIQELLNHTAGVHDGDYEISNLKTNSQIEQARLIAQQKPFFDFQPGTAWLYSNSNYLLIGAIVEQVIGKPLAQWAATDLFRPLGLEQTAFDSPSDIVVGRVSGYTPSEKPSVAFENATYLNVELAGAAGAMRSSATNLCRWHHLLFSGEFLSTVLTEKMTLPARLRNGKLASANRFSESDKPMGATEYGLGLMLDRATRDGSLIVNHHGGINGFASYLATHIASGLSFSCLCNVDTHPNLPFREIRRKIFMDFLPPAKA